MDENNKTALDEEVIEGEEVVTQEVDTTNQATVLLSLEEMIKHHIASIDKLSDEVKKHRQMFADAFENSEAYREAEKKVKEASKDKGTTREQILKQPAMQSLGSKIKDLNTDLKEKKGALSDYLLEFQRLSGLNEIEDLEGQVREIINNAKLIKRTSREVPNSQQH